MVGVFHRINIISFKIKKKEQNNRRLNKERKFFDIHRTPILNSDLKIKTENHFEKFKSVEYTYKNLMIVHIEMCMCVFFRVYIELMDLTDDVPH